ncbi:hypothetical protein PSTT_17054 [Puccinia striiformis]|uniref:Uncharacterized protein n=1 Tax=Puccinia striiformis TaxID=27350 RepID=A0A2S4U9U1_9BASI|nr:hypothetical protein PSTT_17054 [Puccinia striiformis]
MAISAKKNEDASEPKQRITERNRRQGDSIVEGFEGASDQCSAVMREPAKEGTPLDQLDLKRDLFAQLKSSLLPELRQHVIALTELVKLDVSLSGPTEKFGPLLKSQAGLARNILDRISSVIRILCPDGQITSFTGINDQHLNELKPYRLHGLYLELASSLFRVFRPFCSDCQDLIHRLTSSTRDHYKQDPVPS